MIIYKVYYKNYELKKGEFLGMLIERRKDLRGLTRVESGLRWAKLAFGRMVNEEKKLLIIPVEFKFRDGYTWLKEKGILTKEEIFTLYKLINLKLK